MTTVDRLGGTTSVNDDDLLVIYKRNNRRTRNVSAQDFATFAADSAPVQSVNNKTGDVQLDTDDIPEGAANLYFTDARASAAAPVQSVNTQTGDVVLGAADVGADPSGTAAASMAAHLAAPDPHPQYLTETEANALYAKTASNLGAGSGVFASKVGTDLQFKSLVAGANITLTPSGSEIQIAAASVDFLNTTRINVASAATVNLTSSAPNTRNINITGTTTITAFTVAAGQTYFVRFADGLTLTNNASIVTQTGANIQTVAGDTCIIRATAENSVEVLSYCRVQRLTQGTAQNATSGTAIDFTGIPAWAKIVTFILNGVSTSGTSNLLLQLGTSGGISSSGYSSSATTPDGTTTTASSTAGMIVTEQSSAASNTFQGIVSVTNISTNAWVSSGNLSASEPRMHLSAGGVTLSGTLDRIRLTTVNGTDTFDAGSVNIIYEG